VESITEKKKNTNERQHIPNRNDIRSHVETETRTQ
jgi:hypothetical protein